MLHTPSASHNLVLDQKLCHDNHVIVEFHAIGLFVKETSTHRVLAQGATDDALYKLESEVLGSIQNNCASCLSSFTSYVPSTSTLSFFLCNKVTSVTQ